MSFVFSGLRVRGNDFGEGALNCLLGQVKGIQTSSGFDFQASG